MTSADDAVPTDADRTVLGVEVVAGLAGLTGVMAVLHARAVELEQLRYEVHGSRSEVRMLVALDRQAAQRLVRQIERRADVTAAWVDEAG